MTNEFLIVDVEAAQAILDGTREAAKEVAKTRQAKGPAWLRYRNMVVDALKEAGVANPPDASDDQQIFLMHAARGGEGELVGLLVRWLPAAEILAEAQKARLVRGART